MTIELWKSFFEIGGVVLLFLTFAFGAGVLYTSNAVNKLQADKLQRFDADLITAKSGLAAQQERAAKAEGSIALAEQHAAEANAKAEGFRLDIAQANESARLADARAAEAELALANIKLPRKVSLEQQNTVMSAINGFAGQEFSLSVVGDSEALDLLASIKTILLHGGWRKVESTGFGDINVGDAALGYGRGVIVRCSPSPANRAALAAKSLADTLNRIGIVSKVERDQRVTNPNALDVLVGSKPLI